MSGLAYKKDALAIKTDKMVRVLRGGNIGEEQFCFKNDDVFISSELVKPELYLRKNYMITPAVSSLDHIGKIALIDKDYSDTVVGGFVLMLIPHFNDDVVSQYLLYAFAAKHHRDNCRNITHKSGQAFYNLSREQMMNLPVPIPPREEMERITAMLKRVLPKVADYAVVDIALQKLNSSFPEALKKSILQEAVQGKLVPQDPSDEPAEALLERIRAEKQRLIKEGKIKKDKHESVIFRRDNSHYEKRGSEEVCIDEELPFEIPSGWSWSRLGTCLDVRDGTHDTPRYVSEGVPLVTSKNLSNGRIDFSTAKLISREDSQAINQRSKVDSGDIMYAMIGSIGNPVLYQGTDEFSIKNMALFKNIPAGMYMEYVYWFLVLAQEDMRKAASGGVQAFVSLGYLRNYLIPVPPIAEQKRICDTIKQTLPLLAAL